MSGELPSTRPKLDFETPEERQARLGNLFASISQPTTTHTTTEVLSSGGPSAPKGLETWNVGESDVLARARAFLPILQSSNAELLEQARKDPQSVDVENVDGQERVIAMDLGLGVFDVKHGESHADLGPEVDMPVQEDEDSTIDEDHDKVESDTSDSEDSSSEEDDSDISVSGKESSEGKTE
ncbi:hypothetical protein BCR39DRAFT_216462 [Naematelia encephala]|uniref:Uncharacterized protein n=1 Tax=Naematelia encephala TaxID=71784 RepID=A0A1Y2AZA1_9TREE|nr:hypothetical protein BCR39DRAFT_216462 [Naematelia encephala]